MDTNSIFLKNLFFSIFVSFLIQNPSDFNVDQIQRCLCKFGKISSIELLGREKSEAHVTFENDTSAYLLWMHYRFGKKLKEEPIFDVKPAVNVKLTYIIDTPNKRR